ncbi:hypothetical protein ACFH04_25870 [Streptomyces noboritoensis]|uniref:Uncharacterized protein n=1 Tax=Streptomyces noboritoensis TaxID=67337 RepID=A0ABV6TRL4_9ACTN
MVVARLDVVHVRARLGAPWAVHQAGHALVAITPQDDRTPLGPVAGQA